MYLNDVRKHLFFETEQFLRLLIDFLNFLRKKYEILSVTLSQRRNFELKEVLPLP